MDLIPVSLFDTIELKPPSKKGIELITDLRLENQEDNLLVKTIRRLELVTGDSFSLQIILNKNIPTGAGLGGGSGNAAGLLMVMNDVFTLNLSSDHLREIAIELGADVPFFLDPQPGIARGLGEKFSPLKIPHPLRLILVYPNLSISTGEAYSTCRPSSEIQKINDYSLTSLSELNPAINSFWNTLSPIYPELVTCKNTLAENGAIYSGLSGSGSTVFGIFENGKIRDTAREKLMGSTAYRIISCDTLSSHRYFD